MSDFNVKRVQEKFNSIDLSDLSDVEIQSLGKMFISLAESKIYERMMEEALKNQQVKSFSDFGTGSVQ